jgi:hypothetical protein
MTVHPTSLRVVFMVAVSLLLSLPSPSLSVPSKFLWVSDVHLDPDYGTAAAYGVDACKNASAPSLGSFKCDSPEALVNLTFSAMNQTLLNPDFVLLTGDSCRHGMKSIDQLEVRRVLFKPLFFCPRGDGAGCRLSHRDTWRR